ncbi:MAG: RNA-directed DNA polymerase [Pseudomonadota bacterium]
MYVGAARRAARGKRGQAPAARFEANWGHHLATLRRDLGEGSYVPGRYVHFHVHEPKLLKISAAPFRDRVVHHALCQVIEPAFEARFIANSFANRVGKGTHAAVDELQALTKRYRYALRLDVVQFFPAVDHEVLLSELQRVVTCAQTRSLIRRILASGAGVLDDQYTPVYFPGDDLLAATRPRGLPIGNLTSQFWANCYLNPFDHFVRRELGCTAYLRYVDDLALFSDSKRQLQRWRESIVERLARLRLTLHERSGQVMPGRCGVPWLGFVVFPTQRRVKARKVRHGQRRLAEVVAAYRAGRVSFAQLDASFQGWINHVRYGDTWGLRKRVLSNLGQVSRR